MTRLCASVPKSGARSPARNGTRLCASGPSGPATRTCDACIAALPSYAAADIAAEYAWEPGVATDGVTRAIAPQVIASITTTPTASIAMPAAEPSTCGSARWR